MKSLLRSLEILGRGGPLRLGECLFCKAYYRVLRRLYDFHPWHAAAPYACRPYKADAVALPNSVAPRLVVEIGCGLGEMVSRIEADRRVGLDIDPHVVPAAQRLHGRKAEFKSASFFDAAAVAEAIGTGPIDLLVMINWPHGFDFPSLTTALRDLSRRIPVRHLLIDSIQGEEYPYFHSEPEFSRLGEIRRQAFDEGEGRGLYLIKLRGMV